MIFFHVSSYVLKIHPFFEKSKNLICRSKFKTYENVRGTRTWSNFENHSRNHQFVKTRCPYTVPSGPNGSASKQRGAKRRVNGWDVRCVGMVYLKFSSMFSILFEHIEHVYIYISTYICIQIFSLTLLWVSKFDVKFRVGENHV